MIHFHIDCFFRLYCWYPSASLWWLWCCCWFSSGIIIGIIYWDSCKTKRQPSLFRRTRVSFCPASVSVAAQPVQLVLAGERVWPRAVDLALRYWSSARFLNKFNWSSALGEVDSAKFGKVRRPTDIIFKLLAPFANNYRELQFTTKCVSYQVLSNEHRYMIA